MVLLIGNYALDRQQSMQRFATMMLQGLNATGVSAEIVAPLPILGKPFGAESFLGKWLAYIDKFVLFPRKLRARIAKQATVIHICDHSNAMYAAAAVNAPTVVTCHDLIAVRQALGEELHCPVSFTGRLLQRWILRSLRRADAVVCVSNATRDDAERLVARDGPAPKLAVISNGLNYPYRKLPESEALARFKDISGLTVPFVLHIGSNLPRKNRDGVIRIFALTKEKWNARLVFAGDALTSEQSLQAQRLGIRGRIVQIENATNEQLEALYSLATALLYPSFSEGFGWPIIEAQACGCPVVCSNIPPMPETAGDAALLHDVIDEQGFADDLVRLNDPAQRAILSERGLRNAEQFSTRKMIARYIDVYRSLGAQL
jgi:glycosyltransferase involved in cell wall biosynthesis